MATPAMFEDFEDDADEGIMEKDTEATPASSYMICVRVSREGITVAREPVATMEHAADEGMEAGAMGEAEAMGETEHPAAPPPKPASTKTYQCDTIEQALKAVLALYRREPLLDRDDARGEWQSFMEAAQAERGGRRDDLRL